MAAKKRPKTTTATPTTAKTSTRKTSTRKTSTRKTSTVNASTKATTARKVAKGAVTTGAKRNAASAVPKTAKSERATSPVLLSGGNPQIAKGYGDAPVQAYINALSGWRRDVTRHVDALISRTLPKVRKAVKWNSPLYGMQDDHFFLGIHIFAKYVKVAFFTGRMLDPMPPGESKTKSARYLDIREDDTLNEQLFMKWLRQASRIPGEKM